jgi:ZIP family zinc transporter
LVWTTSSGLEKPMVTLLCAASITYFRPLLPFSLDFAGGVMLHDISDEFITASYSHGNGHGAICGFKVGFILLPVIFHWLG